MLSEGRAGQGKYSRKKIDSVAAEGISDLLVFKWRCLENPNSWSSPVSHPRTALSDLPGFSINPTRAFHHWFSDVLCV